MRKRYFIGIEPDTKTKHKLPYVPEDISRKDLHSTLVYLGPVDNVSDIDRSISSTQGRLKSFSASYSGVEDFKGRYLHTKIKDNHRLSDIVNKLNNVVDNRSAYKHSFNPHITLNPWRGAPEKSDRLKGKFPVNKIHLYQIENNKSSPNRLTKVKSYKLKNRNIFVAD